MVSRVTGQGLGRGRLGTGIDSRVEVTFYSTIYGTG